MATEKTKEKKTERKMRKLVATRGRVFEGEIIRKFPKRITIELERTILIPKYERYMKKKTRIHARLPEHIKAEVGDVARVQECRPLSKIIHFMVIGVTQNSEEATE